MEFEVGRGQRVENGGRNFHYKVQQNVVQKGTVFGNKKCWWWGIAKYSLVGKWLRAQILIKESIQVVLRRLTHAQKKISILQGIHRKNGGRGMGDMLWGR